MYNAPFCFYYVSASPVFKTRIKGYFFPGISFKFINATIRKRPYLFIFCLKKIEYIGIDHFIICGVGNKPVVFKLEPCRHCSSGTQSRSLAVLKNSHPPTARDNKPSAMLHSLQNCSSIKTAKPGRGVDPTHK